MATFRMKYVKAYRDHTGRQRYYLRKPGCRSIPLPGQPGSKAFAEAYEAGLAEGANREIGADRVIAGSFSALIALYYKSPAYRDLKPITKATYRNALERFRKEHGDKLVKGFKQRHVVAILDGLTANQETWRKVIRLILNLAVGRGWIEVHPMTGLRRPKKAKKGFRAWTEADIAKFLAHWKAGSRERLALMLLLFTAQRRADVTRLGKQHRTGDALRVVQQKGNDTTVLEIPISAALRAELDQVPADQLTYLQTQYGAPFTPAGFTNWFVDRAKDAGLTDCTPHGLRKAALYLTAEGEGTGRELMALGGHKNLSEVTLYTAAAEQKRLARSAMRKLERRTKLTKGA